MSRLEKLLVLNQVVLSLALILSIVISLLSMMHISVTLLWLILLAVCVVGLYLSCVILKTSVVRNSRITQKTLRFMDSKMEKSKAEAQLKTVLSNNPDPSKWSFWIKLLIAVLSAILGIIGENKLDLVTNLQNMF